MSTIITALTSSGVLKTLKILFFTAFGLEMLQIGNDSIVNNQDFFDVLFKSIPSNVLGIMGIIGGVIWLINKGVKKFISLRESWHLSNIKIKHEKEELERDEIDTEVKKQELNK